MDMDSNRTAFPLNRPSMPTVTLDGPSLAIFRREVGRLLQERGLRFLVPVMLGINALIAYSFLSIYDTLSGPFEYINILVLAQWLSVYGIGLVLIAGRSGTSITTERSRDTWTLLRATPAKPVELVLGHMGSAIGGAAILAISQLPILIIFALCAEESVQQKLAFGCAVGLTSWIACAAWSVWMSAQFRRISVAFGATIAASLWAIGYIPLVIGTGFIAFSVQTEIRLGVLGYLVDILHLLSPINQFSMIFSTGGTWSAIAIHVVLMTANILFPIYVAARAIRRETDPALPVSSKPAKKRPFARTARPDTAFVFNEVHPIYGLERKAAKNDGGVLGRIALALIALYVIALGFSVGSSIRIDPEVLFVIFFVFMAMTVWRSAISVATNRELASFDMIAMTGLRSHEIVRDVVRASATALRPMAALLTITVMSGLCGFYYFDTAFNPTVGFLVFAFLATLALCMTTQLTCGTFSSIAGKGTREAVVLSVLLAFIMYFGVPTVVASLVWSIQEASRIDLFGIPGLLGLADPPLQFRIELIVGCTTPFFGLLGVLDGGNEIPRWTWFVSMGVGLAWAITWYVASVWLMRRRLLAQTS